MYPVLGGVLNVAAVILATGAPAAAVASQAGLQSQAAAAGPAQHEHRRDPYVPVAPPERRSSPTVRWCRDGYVSVQVNVDAQGNNILGDAANEPSIAVDPTDPNRMVIGWRQFDTIASDFRQAGWAYTRDGGQTWTFPGVIEPGVFRTDPVVDADALGNFYYNSLTLAEFFECRVFKSTDGGVSWDGGTYAHGGDKPWQVIDTTDGPGRGHIYASWVIYYTGCDTGHFTRSTDGGQTFEPCTVVSGRPYWGTLAVGPDGTLYVCGDGMIVAKSTNAKYAGQTIKWTKTTVDLDGSMLGWAGPNPGGLLGQLWIAVNPVNGHVYLLCSVRRHSTTDPCDVMFARSTDGGQTWSAPVRVNDDPADSYAWQWFGTMAVAPDGRIDAVWLDTRGDPNGYNSELYYSYSEDEGQTWSVNVAISPPFDPHLGWPQQKKLGDYFDMTSDAAGVHLAYAATFNGEQDVYYIDVPRRLVLGLPEGVPTLLTPGLATHFAVRISPGAEGYVPGSGRLHYRYDGGAFRTVLLAPIEGDLYRATLPPAYCGATPEFYISAVTSAGGVVCQPPAAPADVFRADAGELVVFYAENLQADPGWDTEGLWAFGQPKGAGGQYGGADPVAGYSGPFVYGYNLEGDYENKLPELHLTSTPIDCTGRHGVRLSFWRWLGVENREYDHAYVRVSNESARSITVWHNPTISLYDGQWVRQEYDISAWADDRPGVRLRWTMGATDGGWQFCGWNIDDITLAALECNSPIRPGDLDCDGQVDFDDVGPFVLALLDPAGYASTYPDCLLQNADCNGDGQVNPDDVNAFVALLSP